jgi:hypothetical protein
VKIRFSITVSLLIVLAMALAYGQSPAVSVRLNIPFKFMVGKKEMPAGKYEFAIPGAEASNLLLRNSDTSKAMNVHIIERLAGIHSSGHQNAGVVFDTVGDQKFLSEFWPGGNEDGFLLGVTKGEQKHKVLTQN